MSKYVDVDELLNRLPDDLPYKASVKRVLMQAPTADVVEVVRCKDCIFASVEDGKIKCYNTYGLLVTKETEYCSRGKRREQNEG